MVLPYMSNTTTVTLSPPVWSGDYATLSIQGNQASSATNSTGATVAEWAIVGSRRQNLNVSSAADRRRAAPIDLRRFMQSRDKRASF